VTIGLNGIEAVTIERQPLWPDLRNDHGPFDLIGDIHGCFDDLAELLETMGYRLEGFPENPSAWHPEGRKVVFLGDLVNRGMVWSLITCSMAASPWWL
jgi:protein phosphatase